MAFVVLPDLNPAVGIEDGFIQLAVGQDYKFSKAIATC